MSLTTRVIASLALGLATGVAAYATRSPALLALTGLLAPLGTLWVNAILMTVVPLVVSSLFAGVLSTAEPRLVGRLGGRALLLFVLLASTSATLTAVVGPRAIGWLSTGPSTVNAPGAAVAQVAPLTVGDWITGLIPANPLKAAADGSLLPLVVATLLFALAVTRLPEEQKQALTRLVDAVAGATRVLVGWVLRLAPVGVFALALQAAARLGVAAAGVLGTYVVLVASLSLALLLPLYALALTAGRTSQPRFARAVAPAQAVALSSRSSLASLPALIEGADGPLGLPRTISGFCLPLAVSAFKYCAPVTMLVGVLVAGRVYGIALPTARLVQAAILSVLMSFAVPGVPGGGLLVAAPIFAATGVPMEMIGMLLAADTLADMFRAMANVTADLAVATVLSRASMPPAPQATTVPAPGIAA